MKKAYLLLIVGLLLPIISNAQSATKLFNGKNLAGWYAFIEKSGRHDNADEIFQVNHKMIRLYGDKAGYLMSEPSFKNFQLTLEFKWNTDSTFTRKNNSKNSGIMYLVPTDTPDMLWPKGIQFQVKEGATGDFILLHNVTLQINGKTEGPGASVVTKRFTDATKAIGKWNKVVISVEDGKVTQHLNGQIVNEGVEASVNEGRVLLQYEGYPIDFRKIVIKEL
nr:DUF1080 domain-containing protein [uncultured Carboxylicivirga sp.]